MPRGGQRMSAGDARLYAQRQKWYSEAGIISGHIRKTAKKDVPEYRVWRGMKDRCLNPRSTYFSHYGGRGITICAEWLESFGNFYRDMGPRPSFRHQIERKENDGPYSPENCKWALPTEQSNNRRSNARLTWNGETHTMSEWARALGLTVGTIWSRIHQCGWSVERALGTPAAPKGVRSRTRTGLKAWACIVDGQQRVVYSATRNKARAPLALGTSQKSSDIKIRRAPEFDL